MRTPDTQLLNRIFCGAAALAAVLSPVLAGCDDAGESYPESCVCVYAGVEYSPGQEFDDPARNVTCTCQEDATVLCEARSRPVDPWTVVPQLPCMIRGTLLLPGERAIGDDGCSTCVCGADGRLTCSPEGCYGCTYEGQGFLVGQRYLAADGCNVCTCQPDGTSACTTNECPVCWRDGKGFYPGIEYLEDDGCTVCICQPNGQIECQDKH